MLQQHQSEIRNHDRKKNLDKSKFMFALNATSADGLVPLGAILSNETQGSDENK